MKLIKAVISILATTILLATPAAAEKDPNKKLIQARQGYYKNVGINAGPLFGMAKGKIEYDAELASLLANNLSQLGGMNNSRLWPEGTDNTSKYKTRALPEIWSTYPEIVDRLTTFSEATTALSAVAGNGLEALRGGVRGLGKACKGCHDDFRAEE